MVQAYPNPQQGQGISKEEGGPLAPAGVWEHPDSGQRAITLEDPLFGNAQSQAFKRLAFKFVRPADPDEIKTMPQLAIDSRAADENNMKGLSARLDKLENVSAENEKLAARVKELEAEKLARDQTDAAAKKDDTSSEKPLNIQNDTEVRATAEAEGVDLSSANTVKEKRALVQAARDAKQESEKE